MGYAIGQPVLWPLPPNWAQPVKETLAWLTDVQIARTGTQQKRQLRLAPRRAFAFQVVETDVPRQLLDAVTFDQGVRQWSLPIYIDEQLLAADVAAGAVTVPCATAGYDFSNGGTAVLWRDNRTWELLSVLTVNANSLTLATGTAGAWAAGTRLYPVRLARSVTAVKFAQYSDTIATADVQLLIDEPCDWPGTLPTTTYRGVAVLEQRPETSAQPGITYNRQIQTVDENTGPVAYLDLPGMPFRTQSHDWQPLGRAEHTTLRGLLYGLAGRAGQLWVPSWQSDMTLASAALAADPTVLVDWCGYTTFGREQINRKDIRIELANGTVLYRRITASLEYTDTEQLTLDSALGVDVDPASVVLISFLSMCQLASDTATITHINTADGVATASTPWQAVKHVV